MQEERKNSYEAAAEAAWKKYDQAVKIGVCDHTDTGAAGCAVTWLTAEYAYLGANGIAVDPKLTLWMNPAAAATFLREQRKFVRTATLVWG